MNRSPNNQPQLLMVEKVVNRLPCDFGAVSPAAQNRIAGGAKKTAHRSGLMIVVNEQYPAFIGRVTANGANTFLLGYHALVIRTFQSIFSPQGTDRSLDLLRRSPWNSSLFFAVFRFCCFSPFSSVLGVLRILAPHFTVRVITSLASRLATARTISASVKLICWLNLMAFSAFSRAFVLGDWRRRELLLNAHGIFMSIVGHARSASRPFVASNRIFIEFVKGFRFSAARTFLCQKRTDRIAGLQRGYIARVPSSHNTVFAPSHWFPVLSVKLGERFALKALGTAFFSYTGVDHDVHVALTRCVDFMVRLVGLPPFGPFSLGILPQTT